jgi:hypothetical protein
VVVDRMQISAIEIGNRPVGPTADLSGSRGFVSVTAFEIDAECRTANATRPVSSQRPARRRKDPSRVRIVRRPRLSA